MRYQPRHATTTPTRHRGRTLLSGAALLGTISGIAASNAHAATPNGTAFQQAVKHCESSGNYTAQNPKSTASGAYQFLDTTWAGLNAGKGYAHAKDAPKAVQDAAFAELYAQAGASPWEASRHCWSQAAGNTYNADTNTGGTRGTTAYQANSSNNNVMNPQLTAAYTNTTFPYAQIRLTDAEQAIIDQITAKQQQAETWTPQAAQGKTVTRTITTSGIASVTHDKASFTSASVALVNDGDKLTGRYIDTDWFQITVGEHAGQYISTANLHRENLPINGNLNADTDLVDVPNYLRALMGPTDHSLNPVALKQLIRLNAAYRYQTGTDLAINEGYRSLATQRNYNATLGADVAAKPGTSNHGLGLAIDISGKVTIGGSAGSEWMNNYSRAFGFDRPAIFDRTSTEYWHYNFVG